MQLHGNIRMIVAAPRHMNGIALIQHIDDLLLHIQIQLIIQCIQFYCGLENLLKLTANLRQRIGNDRKTILITRDILIRNSSGFRCMIDI